MSHLGSRSKAYVMLFWCRRNIREICVDVLRLCHFLKLYMVQSLETWIHAYILKSKLQPTISLGLNLHFTVRQICNFLSSFCVKAIFSRAIKARANRVGLFRQLDELSLNSSPVLTLNLNFTVRRLCNLSSLCKFLSSFGVKNPSGYQQYWVFTNIIRVTDFAKFAKLFAFRSVSRELKGLKPFNVGLCIYLETWSPTLPSILSTDLHFTDHWHRNFFRCFRIKL